MNETTFENAKVKDRVWDYSSREWGTIVKICSKGDYPIHVILDNHRFLSYTIDGKLNNINKSRSLYWDKVPEPVAPPRPKRIIKKTIRRWILHSPEGIEFLYFNHQSADNATIGTKNICIEVTGEYEIEE